MKVLMLGWELPPYNSGGLGVACVQLCRSLQKQGAEISFVVPYSATHDFDFMEVISAKLAHHSLISGVYDSAEYTHHASLTGSIFDIQEKYVQAIQKVVKQRTFDIIHAHDWLTFRAGLRLKELSGKPLILHVHSIESDRAGGKRGNPLVHEIEQTALMIADKIVAVSELTKQKIVHEYGIPHEKIVVAHNSIDLEDMVDLENRNAYALLEALKSKGYSVVCNIGRLTIQKGLANLLEAAQVVIQHQPKTIFLIVGSGDQKRELIEKAASLGISQNVIFTDFQRGKRWRDAYAIADLFVMPSISEPFGLTPLEAIFYGTPSLISKQSGIAEVFRNCLKVDFWDKNKMANDIVGFLRNTGLRETLRHNAESELREMNWDSSANTLMETYRSHKQAVAA